MWRFKKSNRCLLTFALLALPALVRADEPTTSQQYFDRGIETE